MQELTDLLAGRRDDVPLDLAALQLAAIEFPGLDPAPSLAEVDRLAGELRSRIGASAGGAEYVQQANRRLFDELGFRGDENDYFHPRNSCLNHVLASRAGLPITLAVLYIEIARRLDRPVFGVGLPGHFLAQYNDGLCPVFIDCFHGGRLLTAAECRELAIRSAGIDIAGDPAALAPVTSRQILTRMVHNLRGAYLRRREPGKAIRALELLAVAQPETAGELRRQIAALRRELAARN